MPAKPQDTPEEVLVEAPAAEPAPEAPSEPTEDAAPAVLPDASEPAADAEPGARAEVAPDAAPVREQSDFLVLSGPENASVTVDGISYDSDEKGEILVPYEVAPYLTAFGFY